MQLLDIIEWGELIWLLQIEFEFLVELFDIKKLVLGKVNFPVLIELDRRRFVLNDAPALFDHFINLYAHFVFFGLGLWRRLYILLKILE